MPVIRLTQPMIERELICPEAKKRIEYCDSEVRQLYVEVRATSQGQGTYYLRYRDSAGTTRHEKIGRTSDMELVVARKKARELKAHIALGADPRGEERARHAVMTFATFFNEHYLPHSKQRKRSWEKDVQLFNLRLNPEFGTLRLTDIARHKVQAAHTAWRAAGLAAATCNHPVKLLRHALNLAVEWDFIPKNPIAGVRLFQEDNKIERYLKEAEMEQLMAVLQTDPNRPICLIATFLLSTGARLSEALNATWDQMDKANRVWRIPAANSKSKRVRAVPLNDSALAVLDQLDTEGVSEHLFVNKARNKRYSFIHKVWDRLRKKAGLPHLRVHDLRHQYASMLVNSGRSLAEIGGILGHSDPSVTQRYAHLSTKSLQDAAQSASLKIQQAMVPSQ